MRFLLLTRAGLLALTLCLSACHIFAGESRAPTVSLRVRGNVADAQVTIDDEVVGPLGYVAARGVALPKGAHRVTVEKAGYFPWDKVVVAGDAPLFLQIDLVPIPD